MDVNTDIYPMEVEQFYGLVIAPASTSNDTRDDFDNFEYINQGNAG